MPQSLRRPPLSAAVVGLGRVGMGYDYAISPGRVASHARAFHLHQAFDLVAGVDPSAGRRDLFESKFGSPTYDSVSAMLDATRPDVVAVSVPTTLHLEVVRAVVAGTPEVIICEKPMGSTSSDAQAIVAAATAADASLVVNYMRRFEPGAQLLHRRLASGQLGEPRFFAGWYSRGLLENGSHLIDLLLWWLGPCDSIAARGGIPSSRDEDVDIELRFGDVHGVLLSGQGRDLPPPELTIVTSTGVVRYLRGGHRIEYETATASATELTSPDGGQTQISSELGRYQYHVVDHVWRHASEELEPHSAAADAVRIHQLIESIL